MEAANQSPPVPQNPVVENSPSQQALTPRQKRTYKTFVIASGSVIVLLAVALLFFSLGKKSATPSESTNSQVVDFSAQNLANSPTPLPDTNEATPSATTIDVKTTTKIVLADGELDGYVASDGSLNTTQAIQPGRNVNSVTRGFVSFDTSQIPTGITIKAAALRLYQQNTIGTPYTVLGDIRVDHLTYGDSLDSEDYSRAALLGNIGTLAISKRIGWNELDVTSAVRDDFANARRLSQFRVHFAKETTGGDTKGDYAVFTSADKKAINQPELVIEYY